MRRPTVPAVLAACAAAVIAWTGAAGAAIAAPTSSVAAPTGATVTAPAKPAAKTTTATYSHACSTAVAKGFAHCDALVRTDSGAKAVQPNALPAGFGPADLQSAYKLPSSTAGAGQTVGDRRRPGRPERRVRPGHLPLDVRAAAVHDRERLLPQGEPERRGLAAADRGRRLGRRDLPRRRHGLGDLPELPHPAGRGQLRQPGQPGHRGEPGGHDGRQVRLQLLRRRRQRAELRTTTTRASRSPRAPVTAASASSTRRPTRT